MLKYQKKGLCKALSIILAAAMFLTAPMGITQVYALEDEQPAVTYVQGESPPGESEGVKSSEVLDSGTPPQTPSSPSEALDSPKDDLPLGISHFGEGDTLPEFGEGYPKQHATTPPGSRYVWMTVAPLTGTVTTHYVAVEHDAAGPSKEQVRDEKDVNGNVPLVSGHREMTVAPSGAAIAVGPLPQNDTTYDIWVVLEDAEGNLSAPKMLEIRTPNELQMTDGYPKVGAAQATGSKHVEILAQANGGATAYYVAVTENAKVPDRNQIYHGQDWASQPALDSGSVELVENAEASTMLTLPADATDYDVYVVLYYYYGIGSGVSIWSDVVKLDVKTPALTDGAIEVKDEAALISALTSVPHGGTIRLTGNINCNSPIVVKEKTITIDVGAYTLNVTNSTANEMGAGLYVSRGGKVLLAGTGQFNVAGLAHGVFVDAVGTAKFGTSEATVTNATGTGNTGGSKGAHAQYGGKITVNGDATGNNGIFATAKDNGKGSEIIVNGNVLGTNGFGASSSGGANITVNGNITSANHYGAMAGSGGSRLTVVGNVSGQQRGVDAQGGNAIVTGDVTSSGGEGIYVMSGGTVEITGNVEGGTYGTYMDSAYIKTASIHVTGNVTGNRAGIYEKAGGEIIVTGDVIGLTQYGAGCDIGNISIGGNVQGGTRGVMVSTKDSIIEIMGNAIATTAEGIGVYVYYGKAKIGKDVAAIANNGIGVYVYAGIAEIGGNITANRIAAKVRSGGAITIDGILTATNYIEFQDFVETKIDGCLINTTKEGYRTYQDGSSIAWVKDSAPAGEKSHDAKLSSLSYSINGGEPIPITTFQNWIQTYRIDLPVNTPANAIIKLTGVTNYPAATMNLNNSAITLVGGEGRPYIMVTAEDGVSNAGYYVNFFAPYKINVTGGTSDKEWSVKDNSVTVTAAIPEGKAFDKWTAMGITLTAEQQVKNPMTFYMPGKTDISLTAHYQELSEDSHTITAQNDGNGTASARPTSAEAGTEITLTASPDSGYVFKEWQVIEGSVSITANKFTMPSENVIVKAIFEKTAATTYIVTVNNGTGGGEYAKDTVVTIKANDRSGYDFDKWVVKSGTVTLKDSGSSTVTFTMPAEAVTVEATYTKKSSGSSSGGSDPVLKITVADTQKQEPKSNIPFIDVTAGVWFADSVIWAYEEGLMSGTGTEPMRFEPYGNTTRGMVVTILYRLEGEPATFGNSFDDVSDDAYYADAVRWAYAKKIVDGYGSGKFGPNDAITREQLAVILMNYAKLKGYDVSAVISLAKYSDADTVSGWALEAMTWSNAAGLINGDSSKLMPRGNAQRAQAAAILQRFHEMYVK